MPQRVAKSVSASDNSRASHDRPSRAGKMRFAAPSTPPCGACCGAGIVAVPLWPVISPDYVEGSFLRR